MEKQEVKLSWDPFSVNGTQTLDFLFCRDRDKTFSLDPPTVVLTKVESEMSPRP